MILEYDMKFIYINSRSIDKIMIENFILFFDSYCVVEYLI